MATALSGIVASFLVAWLGWWWSGTNRSHFPAWLEAVATVLALSAAIVAGFYAARAFILEFRREQRWEEGQLRTQADAVAGWYGRRAMSDAMMGGPRGYYLLNRSSLPVYEIEIWLTLEDKSLGPFQQPILPPGVEARPFRLPRHVQIVIGDWEKRRSDELTTARERGETPAPAAPPAVAITFRDTSGATWTRDAAGRLFLESVTIDNGSHRGVSCP